MAIRFYKFFDYMNRNGITKTDVKKTLGISSATSARLFNNENISLQVINDICSKYSLQPADIMEFVPDSEKESI